VSLSDTLVELIDIPSVTGSEEEIATALEFRLARRHPVHRIGNALVVGEPAGKPLIALYGHTDTVPVQGNEKALLSDGRISGLGASDMKSGIAVMVHLLEDDAVTDGPYGVVGVFYDREEGPMDENGLEAVLDEMAWLGDAVFSVVLEPTDLRVEVGCNGAMNADVVFLGRSAHSARPWLGDNAITKAGIWLAEMHARQPEVFVSGGFEYREVFSVTTADGGIARNVIPARFALNLNYRFPPVFDLAQAELRLQAVGAAADEVVITDRAAGGAVPADNVHFDRLAELVGATEAKQGWTDVARLSSRGIDAVNYGPGSVAEAHQATESIAVEHLDTAFDVMRRFLLT
jgi:succinyl-diaminopimelate desuccinylase